MWMITDSMFNEGGTYYMLYFMYTFLYFKVHYTINKPPMPALTGEADVCKLIEGNKSASVILTTFALPNKCPMTAVRVSYKHNLEKF